MYANILVPMALDHGISDRTLAIARQLAGEDGKITALHVYDAPEGTATAYMDDAVVKEAYARAESALVEKTKHVDGISAEIIKGHTYRSIIDYAAKNDVDCIVIGSHKPGLSDFLLGSTAARVVRHAPCDVHVHRTS